MRLELDLSKHCIQTELKRLHNRAVAGYFKSSKTQRKQIEQVIEMTQNALSTLDFGCLRTAHPQLAGGSPSTVALQKDNQRVDVLIGSTVVVSFEIRRQGETSL